MGHDLKLIVEHFDIQLEHSSNGGLEVHATFDLNSIQVISAINSEFEEIDSLSEKDCQEIVQNIKKKVFSPSNMITTYKSQAVQIDQEAIQAQGELTLNGQQQSVCFRLEREGENWELTHTLNQTDFSIKPFSALLGAIKIKPEVIVHITIPSSQLVAFIK